MKGLKALYLDTLLSLDLLERSEVERLRVEALDEGVLLQQLDRDQKDTVERLLGHLSEAFFLPQDTALHLQVNASGPICYDDAVRYGVVPLYDQSGGVKVGMAHPICLDSLDDLVEIYGSSVEPVLVRADAWREAFVQLKEQTLSPLTDGDSLKTEGLTVEERDLRGEVEEEGLIIHYVERLIEEAVARRASDIHLEPLESRFRIRFRVDGRLEEGTNPPKGFQKAIISRIKLMAGISIAEKRLPQGGRLQVLVRNRPIDLRVSSLRSVFGETIVMRILDREKLLPTLSGLGFDSKIQAQFEQLIHAPDGIFLVTGPTGSGKSTTLYAALQHMNRSDRKIITIEDPVEYQLPGVNQVQVNQEIEMRFSTALRAILRQAPNVIMIGEIRDAETAEVAMRASLTGHMVYSTLHTNDAPSAVSRLRDMGVSPFLIGASLRGVLAQRLVRLICPHCGEAVALEIRRWKALTRTILPPVSVLKGVGCLQCHQRGYLGRTGIFEMMKISETLSSLICRHVNLSQIRQVAREEGMKTMREDGIDKILSGKTSIEEILAMTMDEPA